MCDTCPYPTPGRTSLERDHLGRKECGKCHHWKHVEHFPTVRATSDGLGRTCKPCRADAQRLRLYGLDRDQINEMLHHQSHSCAVCGSTFAGDDYRIDHDHSCCPGVRTCGRCVRKLLCRHCNTGLGNFNDSIDLLRNAIKYLESQ